MIRTDPERMESPFLLFRLIANGGRRQSLEGPSSNYLLPGDLSGYLSVPALAPPPPSGLGNDAAIRTTRQIHNSEKTELQMSPSGSAETSR